MTQCGRPAIESNHDELSLLCCQEKLPTIQPFLFEGAACYCLAIALFHGHHRVMHMNFRESLDAEIRRLETELANDPRTVQLQELKRVHDLYRSQGTAGVTIIVEAKTSENSSPPTDKPGRKMSPERVE